VIRESLGGRSSIEFDLLVNGVRDGFAHHRVVQPNTMFLPTSDTWRGDLEGGVGLALLKNGIVRMDGTVDRGLVARVRQASIADPSSIFSVDARPYGGDSAVDEER
jgi:hypothetical protein